MAHDHRRLTVSSTRKSRFIYGTPQTVQARYKTDTARYETDKARYKTVKTRYKTVKARCCHMSDSRCQILALETVKAIF